MSRSLTGSTNGSYLQVDKAVMLTPPFSVAGHFRTAQPTRATTGYLWWLGKRASTADWWAVVMLNGKLGIEARDLADNYATSYSTNTIAANTAQHFVATFQSATSRKLVLNDTPTGAAISTASRSPDVPDRTCIGRAGDSSPSGGWLGDVAHVAVWNRVLTAEEQSALANGANPRTISGLVEYHEIAGNSAPEPSALSTSTSFAVTGAPKSTFSPTVQPYTPPPVSGGDSVKKAWTSGSAPMVLKPSPRVAVLTFPAKTVPSSSGRKLYADISIIPEFTGTTITGVTFGGQSMTLVGDNGYGGPEDAALVSSWSLTPVPTGASQLVVTLNKNVWSASADLTAVDDWGTPDVIAGSPAGYATASGSAIDQTIATAPGSLVRFRAAGQGTDTDPIGLNWANAVTDSKGKTPGTSLTTDHSSIQASKSVVTGTSETPKATLASADGRGWLVVSTPPASSSTPSGNYVAARVSVNDTNYESAVTGTPGRVQVIYAELDATANEIRVSLDGAAPVSASWSGTENVPTGDVILGAKILNGVVQTGNNLRLLAAFGSTEIHPANEKAVIEKFAASTFAPTGDLFTVVANLGTDNILDLTSAVKDPSGWGWEILAVDAPQAGATDILDDHRISIDLTNVEVDSFYFNVKVRSLHPLHPSSTLRVYAIVTSIDPPDVEATTVEGGTILINALAGTPYTLVSVADPDNGSAEVENGQIRYRPDLDFIGADEFFYTATNGAAFGSGKVTVTVTEIGTAPIVFANFTASPVSGDAPLTVQFTYTGTEPVAEFAWNAGGTNVSSARNPQFTFYSSGSKSVKLTIENGGQTSTVTKTLVTVTGGTTSPPPPPPPPGGGFPWGLPILMESDFDSLTPGMTWKDHFSSIANTFKSTSQIVTIWQNSGKKPVNEAHIDMQKPGIGEPLGLRVKYPKRDDFYKDGGGCNWGILVGSSTAPGLTTGFKKAAISWDTYFPSDFKNVNASIGRPFKFGGLAGGPFNGGLSGNPWSDGQGTGPEEGMYFPSNTVHASRGVSIGPGPDRGWSLRWQGTGRFDDDKGLIKPLPSLADPRTDVDKTTNPSWTVAAHYGRWQPRYDQEIVRRGQWNTFQIYFKGNSAGRSDGTIEYWINGVRIFEDYGVLFRRYATLAHTIWLGTFFGGTPITDPTDGSPQDNYLYFRNFRFAGSKT